MGELTTHLEQCNRIRSEIIHLDVVLQLFDPGTDPVELPIIRKRAPRTAWFARGEQISMIYAAIRDGGTVASTELAKEAIKLKGISENDRATYREFAHKFHHLLHYLGRRGQLDKIGYGQGARWKLAPQEPDLL